MTSNVWEWCWDLHNSKKNLRVMLGGSFADNELGCRVSHIDGDNPIQPFNNVGFRVARTKTKGD